MKGTFIVISRRVIAKGLIAASCACFNLTVHAHLVHEQSGTINLTDKAAFVVVSLPVSALTGVDDDKNGGLSVTELNLHRGAIEKQVKAGFYLSGKGRVFRLAGILLSLPQGHGASREAATQLMALGRIDTTDAPDDLSVQTTLFGVSGTEKTLRLRVSRNKQNHREVVLTSTRRVQPLTE